MLFSATSPVIPFGASPYWNRCSELKNISVASSQVTFACRSTTAGGRTHSAIAPVSSLTSRRSGHRLTRRWGGKELTQLIASRLVCCRRCNGVLDKVWIELVLLLLFFFCEVTLYTLQAGAWFYCVGRNVRRCIHANGERVLIALRAAVSAWFARMTRSRKSSWTRGAMSSACVQVRVNSRKYCSVSRRWRNLSQNCVYFRHVSCAVALFRHKQQLSIALCRVATSHCLGMAVIRTMRWIGGCRGSRPQPMVGA